MPISITFRILMVFILMATGLLVHGCVTTVRAISIGASPTETTVANLESGGCSVGSFVLLKEHVALYPESMISTYEDGFDVDYMVYPVLSREKAVVMVDADAKGRGGFRNTRKSKKKTKPEELLVDTEVVLSKNMSTNAVEQARVFVKTDQYSSLIEMPLTNVTRTDVEGVIVKLERDDDAYDMLLGRNSGARNVYLVDTTDRPFLAYGLLSFLGGAALVSILGFICLKIGSKEG